MARSFTPEQKALRAQHHAAYRKSDKGKFTCHRIRARLTGIPFDLTFDQWLAIWTESGHYAERSSTGYVMCRRGDKGPYSIENVYIATAGQNHRDAWDNNKYPTPLGSFKKDLQP